MPPKYRLKRCLPRPTDAVKADNPDNVEYSTEVHEICKNVRGAFDACKEATEVQVFTFSRVEDDPLMTVLECGADGDACGRVLRALSARRIRRPFENRSYVYNFFMDSVCYTAEYKSSEGERDKSVYCYDERCSDVSAVGRCCVATLVKTKLKPHTFSSRKDVHHSESLERLRIDMGRGVQLYVECLDEGNRVRLVVRRPAEGYPYTTVCSALTCLLAALGAD